jgi:hypothetical protein
MCFVNFLIWHERSSLTIGQGERSADGSASLPLRWAPRLVSAGPGGKGREPPGQASSPIPAVVRQPRAHTSILVSSLPRGYNPC